MGQELSLTDKGLLEREAGPGKFFEAVGFKVVGQTPYGENLGALRL